MNNTRDGGGPNWKLLLIPAAVIVARGAMRRRLMWEAAGPSGDAGYRHGWGHGPRPRFGGGDAEAAGPGAFRLPPRMERMLDSWHTRAHEAAGVRGTTMTGEPAGAAEPPTA